MMNLNEELRRSKLSKRHSKTFKGNAISMFLINLSQSKWKYAKLRSNKVRLMKIEMQVRILIWLKLLNS